MKTPRPAGGALPAAALLVAATRPVKTRAAVLDLDETCVDGCGERRVVELDRQVVSLRLGLALPRRADFHRAGQDAIVRAFVVVLRDRDDLQLDVERERFQ